MAPTEPLVPPSRARSPWQRTYAKAHQIRRAYYRHRAKKLPVPVVSVGNLHWGGTGKTPTVAALAERLSKRGQRLAIVSRGYKRSGRGVVVVSRGQGPLVSAREAGDEPFLLAESLPGVAVVVAADRYAAGMTAIESVAPSLILLDDGFSHVRLHRDLDLLLFPNDNPFGGGRLAPSGGLREPLSSVQHADVVLLTSSREAATGDGARLASALRDFGFSGPGFRSTQVARALGPDEQALPAGERVVLVSGIARPARAAQTAQALGLEVTAHLEFPDHHHYPESSLVLIRQTAHREGGRLLVTRKDHVKLRGIIDLPLSRLELTCRIEESFWPWLDQRLSLDTR